MKPLNEIQNALLVAFNDLGENVLAMLGCCMMNDTIDADTKKKLKKHSEYIRTTQHTVNTTIADLQVLVKLVKE